MGEDGRVGLNNSFHMVGLPLHQKSDVKILPFIKVFDT